MGYEDRYPVWPEGVTGDVLAEVYQERGRQDALRRAGKFLWTAADSEQSNVRKLAVLAEEFGEVSREVTDEMIATDKAMVPEYRTYKDEMAKVVIARDNLRKELIQVAAVAVAWVESLS